MNDKRVALSRVALSRVNDDRNYLSLTTHLLPMARVKMRNLAQSMQLVKSQKEC